MRYQAKAFTLNVLPEMISKLSEADLLKIHYGRTGRFQRSAEADRGGALDLQLICRYRLATIDAEPFDRVSAGGQLHGEWFSRFTGLEDEILLYWPLRYEPVLYEVAPVAEYAMARDVSQNRTGQRSVT
jgi:hypothetical protein